MTDHDTCGIYKITRKDTEQAYIGLSENIERRWYEHTHKPNLKHSYIDRAIKKYGADRFDLEIIEELPSDRDLLMEREAYWVKYYNTYKDDFHFNLTPGGDFSPSKDPEISKKISKSLKHRKFSEEHKKNISKARKGMKLSEEHKKNISEANSGKKHTPETKAKISKANSGENNPMYGKKHSEEIRKKISEAKSGKNNPMYGKKLSEEHRKKISEAKTGKKLSDKYRKKISEAKNTTGYYHVYKRKIPACKQGFAYAYQYYGDDNKRHEISSVSLEKLEQKVKAKGLEWLKFDNNNGE